MPSPKRGPESPPGSSGWGNFPAGLRVMVVDDDHLCLKVVAKMLKQCSYAVVTCSSSAEALTALREKPDEFDLVLSDVIMPDIDGFKLLEIIGLEMDIPVIMMSSNGDTETVLQGVTHGAVDFLIKPVRTEELRNIWQHVLRKQQAGKAEEKSEDAGEIDQTSPETRKRAKDGRGESEGPATRVREMSTRNGGGCSQGRWEMEDAAQQSLKRPRVHWSAEMHQQFVCAVNSLGIEKAVPKKILELMNVEGLTRENVASHLQKYRLYLKKTSQMNNTDSGGDTFMKGTAGATVPAAPPIETARTGSFPWETPIMGSTAPNAQPVSAPGFLPGMQLMPAFIGQARPTMVVAQQPQHVAGLPGMVPFIPNFMQVQPGLPPGAVQLEGAPPPGSLPWAQPQLRTGPQPAALQYVHPAAMHSQGVAGDPAAFPPLEHSGSHGALVKLEPAAAGAHSGHQGMAPMMHYAQPHQVGNPLTAAVMSAPQPVAETSGCGPSAAANLEALAPCSDAVANGTPKGDSMDIHFSQGFLDDLTDASLLVGSELSMQADPAMDDFLNFLAKDEPDL